MNEEDKLYETVLVLRCQGGDAAAFEEVVARYQPRLRLYVRKMLGSAASSDDVLQDVWLDAVRGIGRLKDPAAISAWLYRIARAKSGLHLRRHPPRAEEPLDDDAVAQEDERFEPDEVGAIYAALDGLTPEHREVLLLRFIEQMSYQQLADVVGCEIGTVRSRLHYAKRALRRAMKGTEP